MSTLRSLRTFVAVAEGGSFAAAAERVALTQAAVSLQMRSLEAELGRALFDRSGRVAVLNTAGLALLPAAQRMLALHDELRGGADALEPMAGAYRLGAVVSAIADLTDSLLRLKQRHPGLSLQVVAAKSGELAAQVEQGKLHAAIVVRGTPRAPAGLHWQALYVEPLVLLAHPGVAGQDARRVLRAEPFLRFDRRERTGALLDQMLRRRRWAVNDFLELNSTEALAELVRQRVGVSLLPLLRRCTWERDPALRVLRLPEGAPRRELGLLHRRDGPAALARALVEDLAAH